MTIGPEALNGAADMKSKRIYPVDVMKRNILHQCGFQNMENLLFH